MKIRLDENLPVRLIAGLSGLGHDVETVHSESISGALDPGRILITRDLDFSDRQRFSPDRTTD